MKNFEEWSKLKSKIENQRLKRLTFHESEIWWCSIGLNIGDEEDGKNENFERPVLILKKFSQNLFIGIPLSTKIKEGIYYINFESERENYSVLLSQIKLMSSKRLVRKINKISRGRFFLVKEACKSLLNL